MTANGIWIEKPCHRCNGGGSITWWDTAGTHESPCVSCGGCGKERQFLPNCRVVDGAHDVYIIAVAEATR